VGGELFRANNPENTAMAITHNPVKSVIGFISKI